MSAIIDKIKVKGQYLLPQALLSRVIGKMAASNMGKLTTFFIKSFIKHYHIDLKPFEIEDARLYSSFNDFFTRAYKKGERPIVSDKNALAHPVDGTISEYNEIYKDAVLQAKGHYYSLQALLGGDINDAKPFLSGDFMTVYLSPKDYHRVHMPLDGKLEKMIFVPGSLFSVNPLTAENVDNLFARNERVICFFKNEQIGEFAVVMVGAMIVASIATVFAGIVAPSAGRQKNIYDYSKKEIFLKKGSELGRFLLGSTVICIFPKNKIEFSKELKKGFSVKMGTKFASIKEGG